MITRLPIPPVYRLTLWTLLATLALMVAIVWRIVWPRVDITLKEPIDVFGAHAVRAGGPIEFVLDYCTDREAFGWVSGMFASNGVLVPAGAVWPATLPPGCHVVHLRLTVPPAVTPGSWRFYMVRHYQPTLLGGVSRHVQSEAFDVVDADVGM